MISSVLGGKGISHLGRGFARLVYQFRDMFLTDDANPLTTPRTAEPGPGTWTVTDADGKLAIVGDRLRGGSQTPTGATWGDSKLMGSAITRAAGRVLVARFNVADKDNDFTFGLVTDNTATDGRTSGYNWFMEAGALKVGAAGVTVPVSAGLREIRPMQYLVAVALQGSGAAVLLSAIGADSGAAMTYPPGIPAYPSARLVWVDRIDTTETLYPCISYLGEILTTLNTDHVVEDVRVVDAAAWGTDYALTTAHDEFTRADSATSLGGSWTAGRGTWGITSNKAYLVSSPGGGHNVAYLADAPADGIFCWDVYVPSGTNASFGGLIRYVDSNNFIYWAANSANNAIYIIARVANADENIVSTTQTWTDDTTFRITLIASGNQYKLFVNGGGGLSTAWATDANSRHTTATGIGLQRSGSTNAYTYDNVAAYPLTVTLPDEVRAGAVPLIFTAGSTLASDTFTDTDSTALDAHTPTSGGAWTEHTGTWVITSNRAAWTAGTTSRATQDVSQTDVECQVEIVTPASPADGFYAGIVGRWADASNYLEGRIRMLPDQVGSDEIELFENVAGSPSVVHKVNLADYFANSTTYTLKMQFSGEMVHVWLDGKPRISYYCQSSSLTGTRFGLSAATDDDGCVFDNWTVKQL